MNTNGEFSIRILSKAIVAIIVVSALSALLYAWEYTSLLRPVPCDKIVHPSLSNVQFSSLSPQTGVEWAETQFPWFTKIHSTYMPQDKSLIIWWEIFEHRFSLIFQELGTKFEQTWEHRTITIGDVFRCFGTPNTYLNVAFPSIDAYYQYFLLNYSSNGYVFVLRWIRSKPSVIPLDDATPIQYLVVLPSGSDSKTTVDAVFSNQFHQTPVQADQLMRDWPGELTSVSPYPDVVASSP